MKTTDFCWESNSYRQMMNKTKRQISANDSHRIIIDSNSRTNKIQKRNNEETKRDPQKVADLNLIDIENGL